MTNVVHYLDGSAGLAGSEADHRISNSLSVISSLVRLKARSECIDDVRRFLLDVAGRIETVARLHRLLAHAAGAGVPMAPFLHDVGAAMKSIAGSDEQFRMSIDCPADLALAPERALRVGLMAAELFANTVKYAHPTGIPATIAIECREENGIVAFSFEDDGIGFPENFDPATHESLGMQILESLTQELHGVHAWQDLGVGLRFTCRFPALAACAERSDRDDQRLPTDRTADLQTLRPRA